MEETYIEHNTFGRQNPDKKAVYLSDLWKAVSQRWRFILGVTVIAGIAVGLISLILPNQYTAESVILPPTTSSSSSSMMAQLSSLGGGLGALAGGNLGVKNPTDMHLSLMRSRTVEDAVVQHFHLAEHYKTKKASDTRKSFEANSTVLAGTKDGLITITATDKDPQFAADLTNGYVAEYKKFSAKLAISEAAQRRLFFEQQLRQAKENLLNAQESLKSTQQSTGILEVSSQMRALVEAGASLRAQLAAKQVQLQSLRSYATDNNPQIIQLQHEITALQGQLAQFGGTDPSSGILAPKKQVSTNELEYIRKAHDMKYYEAIADLLSQQYEAAKIDEAREGAPIQVIDSAVVPDKHSSPKRLLITVGVMLLTLIGLCAWYMGKALKVQMQAAQN
jgi:uncharacterized protein involved in exopolysaccharide biosynthesis